MVTDSSFFIDVLNFSDAKKILMMLNASLTEILLPGFTPVIFCRGVHSGQQTWTLFSIGFIAAPSIIR